MNDQGMNQPFDNYGKTDSGALVERDPINSYFPKEYERKLFDHIDRRFAAIWLVSFVVHFTTALYFSINPPAVTMNRSEIDRMQKQFARLVLENEDVEAPMETELLSTEKIVSKSVGKASVIKGSNSGSGDGRGIAATGNTDESYLSTRESHGAGHSTGASGREASRDKISQEVSSKGLLGLLTSSSTGQKGEGVADLLGSAAGQQRDLDKVLGDLDGLKTTGKSTSGSGEGSGVFPPGTRVRKGERTTTASGIDNLITGIGEAKSTDINRKGNFVVEEVSSIADESGVKSESRNPDAVSEVINSHNSSIQYCYQRELKQNPDMKGKLVIRFTVTPDGKVKDVKMLSSTLNNPRIEQCVFSRISRWDDFGPIDPSKGDATFRQVYTFGY